MLCLLIGSSSVCRAYTVSYSRRIDRARQQANITPIN
ncbi:GSCOCG00008894001-RA-CDS [Cotesia congregata]|nr:GSCOCG00008894001-RA-CDS [Cotesia congregata]